MGSGASAQGKNQQVSHDYNHVFQKELELYKLLDNLQSVSDKKPDQVVQKFKRYLEKMKKRKTNERLLQPDLLRLEYDCYDVKNKDYKVPINGESLLLRAMSIRVKKKYEQTLESIQKLLIENVPELITFGRSLASDEKGFTPLHMAILKKNSSILESMQTSMTRQGDKKQHDDIKNIPCAQGSKFENTIMMAGTPLGVAALTLDKNIWESVWKLYETLNISLCAANEKKDTLVHSFIKYLNSFPEKLEECEEMLCFIISPAKHKTDENMSGQVSEEHPDHSNTDYQSERSRKESYREEVKKLLKSKNAEGLTPLQLAAKRKQFVMFKRIMDHETYCKTYKDDGFSNEKTYDITEIETLGPKTKILANAEEHIQEEQHTSMLEFVTLHQPDIAFPFVNHIAVHAVIRGKWRRYRYVIYTWFSLHILFMSLLTWVSLRRSVMAISSFQLGNSSTPDPPIYTFPVSTDPVSFGIGILSVSIGSILVIMKLMGVLRNRFKAKLSGNFFRNIVRQLKSPYTNTLFEVYFMLFAVSLIIDFALAYFSIPNYENYCLIIAVIIGWYLVLFFLRVFKTFSFFTVLILQVLSDLIKFSVVMGILLIGFSTSMFMVMQGAQTDQEEFSNFPEAFVTMLNIMLGIGDITTLFNARSPAAAILIFIMFVLLTTILLLNALIAMMSNSCTSLMKVGKRGFSPNKVHSRLQKLSVILFVESHIPDFFCVQVGNVNNENIIEWRNVNENKKKSQKLDKKQKLMENLMAELRQLKLKHNKIDNVTLSNDKQNQTESCYTLPLQTIELFECDCVGLHG